MKLNFRQFISKDGSKSGHEMGMATPIHWPVFILNNRAVGFDKSAKFGVRSIKYWILNFFWK